MGRRTLKNLDNRILKRVIIYGSKNGIERISTKKIASDLGITEPTIYVHFETKNNLLKQAYLKAYDNVFAPIEELVNHDIDKLTAIGKDTLLPLLESAKGNPESYMYFSYYMNWPLRDKNDPDDPIITLRNSIAKAVGIEDYANRSSIDDLLISATLKTLDVFIRAVVNGAYEANESTGRILAAIVYHGLSGAKEGIKERLGSSDYAELEGTKAE